MKRSSLFSLLLLLFLHGRERRCCMGVGGGIVFVDATSSSRSSSRSTIACTHTFECTRFLGLEGSECMDGFCSNPFHNGGCLHRLLLGWDKVRTCHSDDPPSAVEQGYCQQSPFDYAEVRIASQDWETSIFGAWIIQILLSELLGVPASIETGVPGWNTDFYNIESSFDYGISYQFDALVRGNEVGDCRKVKTSDPESYQPCVHILPEAWEDDLSPLFYETADEIAAADVAGADVADATTTTTSSSLTAPPIIKNIRESLETPSSLEAVGKQNWFVPRFTAVRNPTLLNYLGLQGEQNRRKLAETFLRPTRWIDYCELVSSNNCTSLANDTVTSRAPANEQEANSYYVEGLYTGHFRATEKNDCETNPLTCTGHFADYPCGWLSYFKQQSHHLGIALESDGDDPAEGYSYDHLVQIWRAANATKSNVIMYWWPLSPLYQEFFGTDAEFTTVTLTPPSQTCLNARVQRWERCSDNILIVQGRKEGSCDSPPRELRKIIVKGLERLAHNPETPEELWSPAYDALQNYRITEFQLADILRSWQAFNVDPGNYDPRHATCQWVVDNIELVQSFIPASYPRVLQKYGHSHWDHAIPALSIAAILLILIVLCALGTWARRSKQVIYHAQVELLLLVLVGFFLVNVGALVFVLPPSDISCGFVPWFTNIGYCFVLAPLLMKLDAINSLNASGEQMRRVRLTDRELYGSVVIAIVAASVFLCAWTVVDPLKREIDYALVEKTNADGDTVIRPTEHCDSKSQLWPILGVAWLVLLLMFALALVLMASRVREDLNDTRTLRLLVISLFVFSCLRLSIVMKVDSIHSDDFMTYFSLTYSIDALIALLIFVVPKLTTSSEDQESDEPLPELFLDTTIMFANISGFTAWSSAREPNQVFKFLETIYASFDSIAEKRRVFKVETVGDCYVAATGIPQPRKDHAVAMAKYASDCMLEFDRLTKELELQFGPDTGELALRIGLHSGPVTGGFLKGKGARFQLFGETMAMTKLMENTCDRGSIQVSTDTAELLLKAKKENWLEKRIDEVYSKQHGRIPTYWLNKFKPKNESSRCDVSSDSGGDDNGKTWVEGSKEELLARRKERLIEWNVQVLLGLLKQIVARREAAAGAISSSITTNKTTEAQSHTSEETLGSIFGTGKLPLEQVVEVIYLPQFNERIAKRQKDSESIEIPENVVQQLRSVVERIASMYNDNPFHNFDHASHVVMAVTKLMNRIIAPTCADLGEENERKMSKKLVASALASALHDHTYGITSDPLTQFACVFAALIHDVDHPGVPNPQLIKEDETLAEEYDFRSVAEQNAFELSWNVLMEHKFAELVSTICGDKSEQVRFRELVVNSVMATDLEDEELKNLRQSRWEKAFSVNDDELSTVSGAREAVNRKATIVLEHLIQAANVSHTMQHWKIYREWNEKLFREMHDAYRHNRAKKNPADYWYQGELDFFDHYVIPLSLKLSECGVFGVSSDEFLNYATKNRAEWAARGQEIVVKMLETYEASQSTTHFFKKIYN